MFDVAMLYNAKDLVERGLLGRPRTCSSCSAPERAAASTQAARTAARRAERSDARRHWRRAGSGGTSRRPALGPGTRRPHPHRPRGQHLQRLQRRWRGATRELVAGGGGKMRGIWAARRQPGGGTRKMESAREATTEAKQGRMRQKQNREPAVPSISTGTVAFASAIGTTIEWYDFFLYGVMTRLVSEQAVLSRLRCRRRDLAGISTVFVGFISARWAASSSVTMATASAARPCWS